MKHIRILFSVLIALFSLCKISNSANILVLEGVPSPSHHIWMRTIMVALTERGHNVTSLSSDIDDKVTPNLHYLSLERVYPILRDEEKFDYIALGKANAWIGLLMFNTISIKVCEASLESNGVKTLLSYPDDFKFDIVLHDFVAHPCLLGVMHKFKYPPLVALTAFSAISSTTSITGSQFFPYIPQPFRNEFTPTFIGRVENYLLSLFDYYMKQLYLYPKFNKVSLKNMPGSMNLGEIEKTAKIVLINSHPAVDIVEPILPNVIPVGGLQIQAPKIMPEDLQKIADNARNGLILFSLGTNMRSDMLGTKRVNYILDALRSIPQYTFIWKFESDNLEVKIPANVHIRAWIPQTEILSHQNTILFITHCGMLSTQESVWYGVPMLGIPIFADQFLNNDRSVASGISGYLDVQKLTDTYLRKEILAVTENTKYRENVKRLSKNFRDQPETPLERAIWWVERVVRNPDLDYLISPSKNSCMFSRQGVDIIVFLTILGLLSIYVSLKVLCKFCRRTIKWSDKKVKRN